jgi:hypothetical protein
VKATRLLLIILAATLASCRPDTVDLRYSFPDQREWNYLLTARADAAWDIGGPGRGSYEVTFEITETVVETTADSVLLQVEMRPVDVRESGLPSPGTAPRTFELRVGPDGDVLEVVRVNGIPAGDLDPDQLVFIGTYRPTLPSEAVRLDDSWEVERRLDQLSTFQQIASTGTLVGFDRDAAGSMAKLSYVGEGPVAITTDLPQGQTELRGTLTTTSHVLFDIDAGGLRDASSSTSGDFDVRVVTSEAEAPLTGTLHLELSLEVVAR